MHIQIETNPLGPLAVLRELPDARLSTLEGLNGIGKTMAVRLLQICTGTIPYPADAPAWGSLCSGLGRFTVTVRRLHVVQEIVWEADSRLWLEDDAAAGGRLHFDRVVIDGEDASLDEVRQFLSVHRIAGDEGMVETLAGQADSSADVVARLSKRVAAEEHGPLAMLERSMHEAVEQLGEWPSPRYQQLVASVREAQRRLEAETDAVTEGERKLEELRSGVELRRRLDELRARAPGLEEAITETDRKITELSGIRDRLQRQVAAIAGRVASAGPFLQELYNARRTVERNRGKLSRALSSASATAAPLGIAPDQDAVRELIRRTQEELEELAAERATLDVTPEMCNLLDDVTEELSNAEGRGLGAQVAVDDPDTGVQLTVTETRGGMQTRRAFLATQPPPPQARDLAERLTDRRRTLSRAKNLLDLLEEAERFRRLVSTNEQRVDAALAATDPDAVAQMQQLEHERRTRDDELLKLAADRAALRQQLGTFGESASEPALAAQLQHELDRAGVTVEELGAAAREAEEKAAAARVRLRDAQEDVARGRRDVARADSQIRRAAGAITHAPSLTWLLAAAPTYDLPSDGATPEQQLEVLDRLRHRLDRVIDRLGKHRAQLGAVESGLRSVARHLRGLEMQAIEYVPELRDWLGQRFSEWFNHERVRPELLPKATGDVSVDLDSRQVSWVEGHQQRSRPLEAFSSGEQAFAYTRAQLAVLDDEDPRPPNRLIVLDEFGAFIAHDRLSGLLAYLRERAEEHPEDQVLVVLPLSRDYDQMAESAVGAEADRLRGLAEEIDNHRYAVQALLS